MHTVRIVKAVNFAPNNNTTYERSCAKVRDYLIAHSMYNEVSLTTVANECAAYCTR
jgi:hypothetical protein